MAKLIALELGKVCRLARAFARALGARIGHLLSFVVSSRLCELYRSLHAFSSRSGPEEGCDRTLPSQCTDDNHGRILESGERSNISNLREPPSAPLKPLTAPLPSRTVLYVDSTVS